LLVSSSGMLLLLVGLYISTLPSHASCSSNIGLAINRSSGFPFSDGNWDFILVEENTDRRILFHTAIDDPWNNEPVRVTYLNDGSYIKNAVKIEILSEDQVPSWHVEKGHTGWTGTAEGKKHLPGYVYLIGFLLYLSGFTAYKFKRPVTSQVSDAPSPVV